MYHKKNYFFVCIFDISPCVFTQISIRRACWMRNLIMHPTISLDQNLSKNMGRYVENTNKLSSFFYDTYPQIYIKKCLRPIRYFKFKKNSLANTWWHGIWFKVKGPFWVEISSNEQPQISHRKCMVHCILQGGNFIVWASCNEKVIKIQDNNH